MLRSMLATNFLFPCGKVDHFDDLFLEREVMRLRVSPGQYVYCTGSTGYPGGAFEVRPYHGTITDGIPDDDW